jgi:hypothetical protein
VTEAENRAPEEDRAPEATAFTQEVYRARREGHA